MNPRSSHGANQPRVCLLVLNWNRAEDSLACLDSLRPDLASGLAALVVCDNGSTDDSIPRLLAWAREQGLQPQGGDWNFALIANGGNLGYAAGNNVGLRFALADGRFDWIWVLNNDTQVAPGALKSLLAKGEADPNLGVIGSTLVDHYQRDLVQYAGGCRYQPLTSLMRPCLAGTPLSQVLATDETRVRLDYVGGAAMLLRTSALRRVGLFNEDFFLYYEEMDLCQRLRQAGYALGWCRESLVYHQGGSSTGGRSTVKGEESQLAAYHENLSTLLYTRRHHPWLLPLVAGLRLAGKSLVYLLKGRRSLFSPLWRAYRDFLLGRSARSRDPQAGEPRVMALGRLP